jgi:hypothetical protein
MDLINPQLQKLSLVECCIEDEQILQLTESGKLVQIAQLDLSTNNIERNFSLLMKHLKENCDFA